MRARRDTSEQDARYGRAAAAFGGAIERLARGYEADAELRRDLVQDVHVALWRSFAGYDGRCSERTWVFRVAHNAASDHARARSGRARLVDLAEAADPAAPGDPETETDARRIAERLAALIQRRRIAARNRREYAACLILPLLFMGVALARGGTFLLLGAALFAAGCGFVAWQLGRRAAALAPPGAGAAEPLIAHQRAALERQRRALAGAGGWYVLPLLPGMLIFTLAPTLDRGVSPAGLGFHTWFPIALILTVSLAVWALNLWAARRLAAQIDELDALSAEPSTT